MWEAIDIMESAPKAKKRGRKPKPKPEGMQVVEKKKRGRPRKEGKKDVPPKKMRPLKLKLAPINDNVKVLFEDGNLSIVNA